MLLTDIIERIENKKSDYQRYNFIQIENNALMTFFDLAQEFESIEDFYNLCVAIPKGFFNLEARLYLIDPKLNTMLLAAKTENPEDALNTPPPNEVQPNECPYYTNTESLVLTIRGKKLLTDQLPFQTKDNVLGLLEIYPIDAQNTHTELFFEKYANRVGFSMHNKFLAVKNIEHLKFIRSLVADIEHNIIVPNMIYKLFLRRLRGKIMKNKEIENRLSEYSTKGQCDEAVMEDLLNELIEVNSFNFLESSSAVKTFLSPIDSLPVTFPPSCVTAFSISLLAVPMSFTVIIKCGVFILLHNIRQFL